MPGLGPVAAGWGFVLSAALLAVPLPALANDTEVEGVGGRVRAMSGENRQIRMVRETVTMEVYPTYYDVTVDFSFANDGPATAVKMGFPESGYPANGGISAFSGFRTWVDGKAVAATRQQVPGNPDVDGYQAYWVKEVAFGAHQDHRIRVQYRAPTGGSVPSRPFSDSALIAEYNFTGGNWQGTVDDSLLTANLHVPPDYVVHFGQGRATTPMTRSGNSLVFHRQNWQAQEKVTIWLTHEPYVMNHRRLTTADTVNLSCDQLWQTRNEIYARHGREFQSPEVRAYFQRQPWYRVVPGYTDSRLTALEKANAATLLAGEHRQGCD